MSAALKRKLLNRFPPKHAKKHTNLTIIDALLLQHSMIRVVVRLLRPQVEHWQGRAKVGYSLDFNKYSNNIYKKPILPHEICNEFIQKVNRYIKN